MDNIRSCIPTDVEKLSKGRLCVCTRMSLFRPNQFTKKINGTCREWLILYPLRLVSHVLILFYLQLILRAWLPWLSTTDVLCAVARLSRAVSARIKMSVSLTYATAIYQALLTKRTIRSRWTEVCATGPGVACNILPINLIYIPTHWRVRLPFLYSSHPGLIKFSSRLFLVEN